MKKRRFYLSLSALLILTGCQSVLDAPTQIKQPSVQIPHHDLQWQQHLAQLQKINSYQAQGQFGYISPEERFSSHFKWQYKTPTNFSLTMSSNLSSKSLTFQRTAQGMTISDEKGRSRTERNVNALMEEIIGVSFPIDQFAYWVKGQPEAHSHYVVNEKRQLAQFDYPVNGTVWQVSFVEYHEDSQPNLPKLISLINGKQTLKIRIDNWVY
ncbi:lipoprotein insertase outer membrane protein LolB [Bibersteinia trehalosi]|uniref:lipoprotein insertase outer membrane protein LolB n=1 Tax=Bibersteinia trehalosi TaxID=47735 RepID=UPI002D78FB70|nr:lipoprotein insertase outer membrane protein LolB [Bibersteinia trehalosi]